MIGNDKQKPAGDTLKLITVKLKTAIVWTYQDAVYSGAKVVSLQ